MSAYDHWKQTDTIGEQLHADDDAVEAMADSMVEGWGFLRALLEGSFDIYKDRKEGGIEVVTSGRRVREFCESLASLLAMPKMVTDRLPLAEQLALRTIRACLRDQLIANGTAAAYIRDERERARLDTEE